MLQLAVATRAETHERMQAPLAERDIAVEHVETAERTFTLGDTPASPAGTPGNGSDALDEPPGEFDVGFVFPPRLAEGGVADALLGVPWVNGREQVLRSRHKGEALARLSRAGVPVPETVVVSDPVDEATLRETFRQFDPPVVVKPNSATRGIGVAKARDLDSFLGVCDYLDLVHDYRATGDRSFLVQEFVPNARDYRAMLVDGAYVGAVERRLPAASGTDERGDSSDTGTATEATVSGPAAIDAATGPGDTGGRWKHNVHRGAEATRVELPARLRDLAESAAAALDVPWLGVDLLVTGDRAVVNETNARPTIDASEKYEASFWDDLAALVRRQA